MAKQTFVPQSLNVVSSADEIGALTDFSRIPGETLSSYKDRFLEDSRRPANSTYEGLINAINRDLGLERNEVVEVTLKELLVFPSMDPSIEILNNTLIDARRYEFSTNSHTKVYGNTLTMPFMGLEKNELRGLTLFLGDKEYQVLSNNVDESGQFERVVIDTEIYDIPVGTDFYIEACWTRDSFVGLSLESSNNNFVVTSNSSNSIVVDSSYFFNIKQERLSLVANRPRLVVSSSRIILYKDFVHNSNYQLDKIIEIKDSGLTQNKVIKDINSSRFFEARDLLPYNVEVYAKTFRQQDSDVHIQNEVIPISKSFRFENGKVKEGSIKFSQEGTFFREVRNLEESINGPFFYVNHKAGVIRSKRVPSESDGAVSYIYKDFPFRIESSPVIITSFSDPDAQRILFTQTEKKEYNDVRDKYMSTQPKSDMIEYVAELLSESKELWGE